MSRLLAVAHVVVAREARISDLVQGSRLMGRAELKGLDRSCTSGGWREEDRGAPKEAN